MAQGLFRYRRDPMSRCQTSTYRQTRFFSCKTCQRASAKTSLWLFSHSKLFLISNNAEESLTTIRYPNLYEVRLIPTKRDIAFVEYVDEASATVAKDALHNYKLDGENKIKVRRYHDELH